MCALFSRVENLRAEAVKVLELPGRCIIYSEFGGIQRKQSGN